VTKGHDQLPLRRAPPVTLVKKILRTRLAEAAAKQARPSLGHGNQTVRCTLVHKGRVHLCT